MKRYITTAIRVFRLFADFLHRTPIWCYLIFQHSCVKARVNGREGVIVAGGSSDADPALTSVEFFDLKTNRWRSLGRTREGRRFPGLMVMGKHLLIAGGETTDQIDRTVILDSMETLVGKRWVPLRQKLPERRSRFSLLRIPRNYVWQPDNHEIQKNIL